MKKLLFIFILLICGGIGLVIYNPLFLLCFNPTVKSQTTTEVSYGNYKTKQDSTFFNSIDDNELLGGNE